METLREDGIFNTSIVNKSIMKLVMLFCLNILIIKVNAQRMEFNKIKISVVSIDPNAKRIFICYDYLFPNEVPDTDSSILKNLQEIKDSLKRYVDCLFELKNISIFRSSAYAKYGPPVDLKENIEWSKQYLGEYNLIKNEYTTFPALKKKSINFVPF